MPSCSNKVRNRIIVWLHLCHLSTRNETDAISSPLCSTKRCESCITLWSSHEAMNSRSNHHFRRSASSHSQWLVISRLIFIQLPILVFE